MKTYLVVIIDGEPKGEVVGQDDAGRAEYNPPLARRRIDAESVSRGPHGFNYGPRNREVTSGPVVPLHIEIVRRRLLVEGTPPIDTHTHGIANNVFFNCLCQTQLVASALICRTKNATKTPTHCQPK